MDRVRWGELFRRAVLKMCDRCDEIGRQLAGIQRLRAVMEDGPVLSWIDEAVKELQSERAALHTIDLDERLVGGLSRPS